jgi:hypothetical protein
MKMETRSDRGRALWGGFLIILGVVLLLEYFGELGLWPWVAFLTFFGLGFYALYATDRTQKGLLIPSYILLAIAGLLAMLELDILRDDAVALYVLTIIAIPFLYTYLRDRRAWWALIPAYVMFAVAGLIGLNYFDLFPGSTEVSYIMFAIAAPFLFVYARNTRNWWALIPGGIMAIIGIAFLLTVDIGRYIGPGVLILVGVWVLFRAFIRPSTQTERSLESAFNMDHLENVGKDWFEGSKEEVPPSSVEAEEPIAEQEDVETEESNGEEK